MPVHYEVNDRVATITIDRPEAMNALDPPMLFGLAEAWDKAEEDDDVWVVVVTGAGDEAFCVGADLKTTIPATAASFSPFVLSVFVTLLAGLAVLLRGTAP